jgi:hypothetical protein
MYCMRNVEYSWSPAGGPRIGQTVALVLTSTSGSPLWLK